MRENWHFSQKVLDKFTLKTKAINISKTTLQNAVPDNKALI